MRDRSGYVTSDQGESWAADDTLLSSPMNTLLARRLVGDGPGDGARLSPSSLFIEAGRHVAGGGAGGGGAQDAAWAQRIEDRQVALEASLGRVEAMLGVISGQLSAGGQQQRAGVAGAVGVTDASSVVDASVEATGVDLE